MAKNTATKSPFWMTAILVMLENAQSAERFYGFLSDLILEAHLLSESDRKRLANIAAMPWSKKRGAGTKKARYCEIYLDYFVYPEQEGRPFTKRAVAIKEISDKFKITPDAAGKSYDIAKKYGGSAPPPKTSGSKKAEINTP